jgi:putative ABC transport system permease protein
MIARMAFSGHMDDEEFERRNRRNKRITWDDYEWVRDHCLSCSEVGAEAGNGVDLKQDGIEFPGAIVFGATANMVEIEDKTIETGRFISNDEVQRSAMVVVLGSEIKDKFFPNTDPMGKTLKIRGLPMRVVGVEEKRGSFFGDSFDRHVYIPVTTHLQIFGRNGLQIHGKARTRETFRVLLEDARVAMRIHRRLNGNEEDDFGLVNVEELNNQIDEFTNSIATRSCSDYRYHADRRRHRRHEHHAGERYGEEPSKSVCAKQSVRRATDTRSVSDRVGHSLRARRNHRTAVVVGHHDSDHPRSRRSR